LADRANISVGDEVPISIMINNLTEAHSEHFIVTGIGTIPRELVADETSRFGMIVLSSVIVREFSADATYRLTNFSLAPGLDAQRDLYPQLRDRGFELDETLTEQGDKGDGIYLLLDGVLGVEVDGETVAQVGPVCASASEYIVRNL
jgi:hypothetical protein